MPYDTENGTDTADAPTKANGIKLEWKSDVKFWLQTLEAKMKMAGVKSQYTKMQVVSCLLPANVADQVKHLLRISEEENTDACYKNVKTYLLELYGAKDDDVYYKAKNMMLTTTPSHLARQLIDIVCPQHPTLQNCCCTPILTGMWKDKLPEQVRIQLSGLSLAGGTLDATLKTADAVFRALGAKPAKIAQLNAGQDGQDGAEDESENYNLAAFNRGGGGQRQNGQKGAGNQRNQQSQGQGQKKKQQGQAKKPARHPDNPPENCCYNHTRYGKSAWCCLDPFVCPWEAFKTPKPAKK